MSTDFTRKLAKVAIGEYDQYHYYSENDSPLREQIEKYWTDLGFSFPGVGEPWSAVFVCWCPHTAGATAQEFQFNAQHSQYVWKCIKNANDGIGVFRAFSN
jgi:hypothetical protein